MDNSVDNEQIEWDIPISEVQKFGKDGAELGLDFSKLSLGTEMRNKMWEQEYRGVLNFNKGYPANGGHHDRRGFSYSESQLPNGETQRPDEHFHRGKGQFLNHENSDFTRGFQPRNPNFPTNGFRVGGTLSPHSPSFSPSFQPPQLQQSTTANPAVREDSVAGGVNGRGETRFGLSNSSNVTEVRDFQNENQTLQRQVIELKAVLTELHALQNGVRPEGSTPGLPDPVQLALRVLKMEELLLEKDQQCKSLEEKVSTQQTTIDKSKKEHEFEAVKLRRDVKVLQEKVDAARAKEKESKSAKGSNKDDKRKDNDDSKRELENARETIRKVTDEKKSMQKEIEDLKQERSHKENLSKIDTEKVEQELKQKKEMLEQIQANEQNRRMDMEHLLLAARDVIDKERQEKYMLLVEQNKLKHKVEKLSESVKSYQIKNDELTRIQNELEQELDGFRKLKKLIQEHGLPNHDQLIMLQQQAESYKEDILSERKDRERAQAQREKMRRDLEATNSRTTSLQEQVYKYQEHIMKLNSERQRLQHIIEAHTCGSGTQGPSQKLIRQLSTPSFLNEKVGYMNKPPFNPPHQSLRAQTSLPGGTNDFVRGRGFRGFQGNQSGPRGFDSRRASTGGGMSQYDSWQRNGHYGPGGQQRPSNQYSMMNNNKGPRSPLLNSASDPWQMGPQHSVPQSQQQQQLNQQFNSGLSYNNGIWSQQPHQQRSPTGNGSLRSPPPHSWQFPPEQGGFPPAQFSRAPGMKPFPEQAWSTATDDSPNSSSSTGTHTPPVSSHDVGGNESGNSEVLSCGKCESSFPDSDSFRSHVEKCFNVSGVSG